MSAKIEAGRLKKGSSRDWAIIGDEDVFDATLEQFISRLTVHTDLTQAEMGALRQLPTKFDVIPANRDFVRFKEKTDHSYFIVTGMVGRY